MLKRFFISISMFLILILLLATSVVYASNKASKIKRSNTFKNFADNFKVPQLGTVPLPSEKQINYPAGYGSAILRVNYPNQVQVGEEFNVSIAYETLANPYSELLIVPYLYIPGGTNLPTQWRQVNESSYNPTQNTDTSGATESVPSLDWVNANWSNWYGVGIAPYESGSILVNTSHPLGGYWTHGHYFWTAGGETGNFSYSPISFSTPGDYTFEVMPIGFYYDDINGVRTDFEPVSFTITAAANSITALVDINPKTLNIKSKDNSPVTAYIELEQGYGAADINPASILLEDTVGIVADTLIGDHDQDGVNDLMVKFDRGQVLSVTGPGDVEINISGNLNNGVSFKGSNTIRIR